MTVKPDTIFGAAIGLLAGGSATLIYFMVMIAVHGHTGVDYFFWGMPAPIVGACIGALAGPAMFRRGK